MALRKIGQHGMELPLVGIGMMSVGGGIYAYDKDKDEKDAFDMIEAAIEASKGQQVHLDTADIYGVEFASEKFVGECVKKYGREKFFIATKFAALPCMKGEGGPNAKPEYVKQCCADSLERMGIEQIDLFYVHRMDVTTPIEATCAALKELIDGKKIRFAGLSEAPAFLVERAVKVCPISCVQQEWSLLCRDLEAEYVPKLRELGVGIVSYSPVARGLLTGQFKSAADIPTDWRMGGEAAGAPDYMAADKLESNIAMCKQFCDLAESKGAKPSAMALAWVLSKGEDVVVIPGSKKPARLLENFQAAGLLSELGADAWAASEALITPVGAGSASGASRYLGGFSGLCFNTLPEESCAKA